MSAVNVTVNFDGDSIPMPGGENAKRFVHAAATGNITLSGAQTIDDIVLPAGKRVLLPEQDDAAENGVWIVRAGAWKRAADFRTAANVVPGSTIYVEAGTVNGGRTFQLTTPTPIVVGTTELEFEEFGGSSVLTRQDNGAIYAGTGGDERGAAAVDLQQYRNQEICVASGQFSIITGGENNIASGNYAVVYGGSNNIASGNLSTVLGGETNQVDASYGCAGGYHAHLQADAIGSFLWNAAYGYTYINEPNVAVFSNVNVWLANTLNQAAELRLYGPQSSSGQFPVGTTKFTAFKAQTQADNITYTLPAADGTAGQVLSTDGNGNLSWVDKD